MLTRVSVALLAALTLPSCGEKPPPAPTDAGARDSGPPEDDAGAAGPDATPPDATLADAAGGSPDAGPPRGCSPGPVLEVARGDVSAMALSSSRGRALLTWVEAREGTVGLYVRAETDEGLGPESTLADGAPPRSPTALGDDEGHWVAWTATAGGVDGYDLRVVRVDPSGVPSGPATVLDPDDAVGDHLPSLASNGSRASLLWVRRDLASAGPPTLARRSLGEPLEPAVTVRDDAAPSGRVVGQRVGPNLAWAWIESTAEGQRIDAMIDDPGTSGASAPISLSTDGRAAGGLDLAAGPDEAAVIWDVYVGADRREVRIRQLDPEGRLLSAERPLTTGPTGGHTPSLLAFGGGYLGLWHDFGGPDGDHVHLALIDPFARAIGGVVIQPLRGELIATDLVADGPSIVTAWIERLPLDGARLQLARVLCNF